MKRHLTLLLACFIACSGCKKTSKMTDSEFRDIISSSRKLERFHYIGTRDKYDYFVGEQWSMHTFGPKAKDTERYYKIENSTFAKERFPLTKDTKNWVLIKQQPSVVIEERFPTLTREQAEELGFDWSMDPLPTETNSPDHH